MKKKFECSIPCSKDEFVDLVFKMTKQEEPFDRYSYDSQKPITIFSSFNPRNSEMLIYTSGKFRSGRDQPMGIYIKVKEEEGGCKLICKYKVLSYIVRTRTVVIILFIAAVVFIPPPKDMIVMTAVYAKGLLIAVLLTFTMLMHVIGSEVAFFVNKNVNNLVYERLLMILEKIKRDEEMS